MGSVGLKALEDIMLLLLIFQSTLVTNKIFNTYITESWMDGQSSSCVASFPPLV